jgi:hypothetical protein
MQIQKTRKRNYPENDHPPKKKTPVTITPESLIAVRNTACPPCLTKLPDTKNNGT